MNDVNILDTGVHFKFFTIFEYSHSMFIPLNISYLNVNIVSQIYSDPY